MTVWLRGQGYGVNRKWVQRLMQILGLIAMVPGPNTSKKHPQNKVYLYLLRGLAVVRPNQVWSTDITYIRLAHGFMYLVAIIDWYSRKVLAWKVSNTMDVGFCMDCLTEALNQYGAPEIFNTDQGSQFTSTLWINKLLEHGCKISMDGRGVPWTIFLLNGYGGVSNTRTFTRKIMPSWLSCCWDWLHTLYSITVSGFTRH